MKSIHSLFLMMFFSLFSAFSAELLLLADSNGSAAKFYGRGPGMDSGQSSNEFRDFDDVDEVIEADEDVEGDNSLERPDFDRLNGKLFSVPYAEDTGSVRSVKDISFKSVKNPFNGSLLKTKSGNWFVFFREQLESGNRSGYSLFDEKFTFKEGPFFFDLDKTAEDFRVVCSANGRIAMVGNERSSQGLRNMLVLEAFETPDERIEIKNKWSIHSDKNEKNWAPFFRGEELVFSYNLNKLHESLSERHICSENGCGFKGDFTYISPSAVWDWGHIRGGTSAELYKSKEFGELYLTFFHSVKRIDGLLFYFAGAMAFETQPPYKMKMISKEPIVVKKLYGCNGNRFVANRTIVAYPTGLVLGGDTAHVSFGSNDSCIKILEFDLKALLPALRIL
jgi:hypothetical protein